MKTLTSEKPEHRPKASVLLPVFNAELYLEAAIHSVLCQTFTDFECLLLDDGSTDRSAKILANFAKADPRCKVYSWPNQGLVRTLNRGIELAASDILFRMDADDISRPNRFEKQFEYLAAHPECVALGSGVLLIDESGSPIREFVDVFNHAEIDATFLRGIGGGITHPAVAIRKQALQKINGYRLGFAHAEDVDLFLRLAEVGRLANLPEVLLDYRQHSTSIGYRYTMEQRTAAMKAAAEARIRRGIEPIELIDTDSETRNVGSLSAVHRKWAWWALGASNIKTARKHAWQAFAANPFDPANLRLIACVLKDHLISAR